MAQFRLKFRHALQKLAEFPSRPQRFVGQRRFVFELVPVYGLRRIFTLREVLHQLLHQDYNRMMVRIPGRDSGSLIIALNLSILEPDMHPVEQFDYTEQVARI
jgi:hypothetical protein